VSFVALLLYKSLLCGNIERLRSFPHHPAARVLRISRN
jgi:hypothetical protein